MRITSKKKKIAELGLAFAITFFRGKKSDGACVNRWLIFPFPGERYNVFNRLELIQPP